MAASPKGTLHTAARRLFSRRGSAATNVRDIAGRVDMSELLKVVR